MIETPPLPEPIDSRHVPLDRYCDLVLDGGVINGVVYPGFLIEIARKFRFHAIGGTSVGAIAAALAAACEYARRFNRDTGFNEGLRKLPENLSEIVDQDTQMTRIRSLFQPDPKLRLLFDFAVAWIASGVDRKAAGRNDQGWIRISLSKLWLFYHYFGPSLLLCVAYAVGLTFVFSLAVFFGFRAGVNPPDQWWPILLSVLSDYSTRAYIGCALLKIILFWHPLCLLLWQLDRLIKADGFGICSGMPFDEKRAALVEWLYEGIQKAAGLTYAKPLTFGDLWSAPGGPKDADGHPAACSIDLRTITSCISHGRAYELPIKDDTNARIFFRISELRAFFPEPVIAHLRNVSKPIDFSTDPLTQRYSKRLALLQQAYATADVAQQISLLKAKQLSVQSLLLVAESNTHPQPDIRELPCADLPIVIAARMSLSVPILFKAIPMLGFNLGQQPENMDLVRIWFSDGGITTNFPIHLFDSPLPRWPTFGAKVMEDAPSRTDGKEKLSSFVPYAHQGGIDDVLIEPKDQSAFTQLLAKRDLTSFGKFIYSLYQTGKDGTDRSYLRMPEVRNRVVQIYTDNITGGALNLMIAPDAIRTLGCVKGVLAGQNIANAYLGQVALPKYAWASVWKDHRWVRFNLLISSLRHYLKGFTASVNQVQDLPSLTQQIQAAQFQPPLQSPNGTESCLTPSQVKQMQSILSALQRLESELEAQDQPIPYKPEPNPALKIKPKL